MTELKKFNKQSKCIKCGCGDVAVSYCDQAEDYQHSIKHHWPNVGEHICRHCRTCHFEWMEAVVEKGTL